MSETYKKEIIRRINKSLLDLQLLRMVRAQPLWGYRIKKKAEEELNIKLRHGALYPTLNFLEKNGYLKSERQQKVGRARKIYSITEKGENYLNSYYDVLKEQIRDEDIKTFNI